MLLYIIYVLQFIILPFILEKKCAITINPMYVIYFAYFLYLHFKKQILLQTDAHLTVWNTAFIFYEIP